MPWSAADSATLYGVNRWGRPYFSINDRGHLDVQVQQGIDLHDLARDLRDRGVSLPCLVRLPDVVKSRIEAIDRAFEDARIELGYDGDYRGVYPIKVNQAAQMVRQVVRAQARVGLEAGSKPELQVVLAAIPGSDALVVCNGFKDRAYVRLALMAQKLGIQCIVVIDRPQELALLLEQSEALGVEPLIGVRSRISSRGAGRWAASGGDRAKFGLGAGEIVELVETLRANDKLHCLQLLHFHIGSQVTRIRAFKNALQEAGRLYVELVRTGANMRFLDVGGGLAVDYDGSQSDGPSSMNYGITDYAWDVVASVQETCAAGQVEVPTLITEAGRATVAHSSLLLFDVLGVNRVVSASLAPPSAPEPSAPATIRGLAELFDELDGQTLQSAFHDAQYLRQQVLERFRHGLAGLAERAEMERWYWRICERIHQLADQMPEPHPDLDPLEVLLADTYYCNFSVFQSIPDSWAIDHLFPVMPVHRLNEAPTRNAVLADLTCDSDGVLTRFIHPGRAVKRVLELHEPKPDEPYVLGLFLVGAYQESLGDLHNLFGDTNIVHVSAREEGGYRIDDVVDGDTVAEVVRYVDFNRKWLTARVRKKVEAAIEAGQLTAAEGKLLVRTYVDGLDSYTYLDG